MAGFVRANPVSQVIHTGNQGAISVNQVTHAGNQVIPRVIKVIPGVIQVTHGGNQGAITVIQVTHAVNQGETSFLPF